MEKIQKKVTEKMHRMRLDMAWVLADVGLSRRKIRQIIDVGGAYHNNKRVRMASRIVNMGDTISLEYNLESLKNLKTNQIEFTAQDMLLDHKDFIVVNKPPLMPSQATQDQSIHHVETCLADYFDKNNLRHKQFIICHRLDKETSGAFIVAKNKPISTHIMNQFKEKTVRKYYLALCHGIPNTPEWTTKCYLSDIDRKTGLVKAVNSGGKPSLTKFKLLAKNIQNNISLIACFPETGRSHQIRVHLADANLPILGDKKYGHHLKSKAIAIEISNCYSLHHMLHAFQVQFKNPQNEEIVSVTAQPPVKFEEIMKICQFNLPK